MITALAVGSACCVTFLSLLSLLEGNPLGARGMDIHLVQLDLRSASQDHTTGPPLTLSYPDALEISRFSGASAFIPVAAAIASIRRSLMTAFEIHDAILTNHNFFKSFNVPFRYGGPWAEQDDEKRTRVAVISSSLNQKLFHGEDSVGQFVELKEGRVRIVGVLAHWRPVPRFYDLSSSRRFEKVEDIFIPLSTGLDLQVPLNTGFECPSGLPDLAHLESSECTWLSLWTDIPNETVFKSFQAFIQGYAAEQHQHGRGVPGAFVGAPDVPDLLQKLKVVPGSVRSQAAASLGFLIVCISNCIALLLAKFKRRNQSIVLLRALGASRSRVVMQLIIESATIGMLSGFLGVAIAWLCVHFLRLQSHDYSSAVVFDTSAAITTFLVSTVATILAGLLPAYMVSGVSPAEQLKEA